MNPPIYDTYIQIQIAARDEPSLYIYTHIKIHMNAYIYTHIKIHMNAYIYKFKSMPEMSPLFNPGPIDEGDFPRSNMFEAFFFACLNQI